MSSIFKLRRDPNWVKYGHLHTGSVILLYGDDPNCQVSVSVPVPILVACSPLVRNIIMDADHLPPSLSKTTISFPSFSSEILDYFREMLVSGTACMDMASLSGVREVFKMLEIEGWLSIETDCVPQSSEDLVEFDILKKMKTENCCYGGQIESVSENDIEMQAEAKEEPFLDHENSNVKIEVKLDESEEKTSLLDHHTVQSSKYDVDKENAFQPGLAPAKQLQINIPRLKEIGKQILSTTSDVENVNLNKFDDCSCSSLKECSKTKIACPQCSVKVIKKCLSRHISLVHNKATAQCPQCNKTLGYASLRKHIRRVHDKETAQCPKCNKTLRFSSLREHIRLVHDKKKAQCPQCDKTLGYSEVKAHIRKVHDKESAKCPECDKIMSYTSLNRHIRSVHKLNPLK